MIGGPEDLILNSLQILRPKQILPSLLEYVVPGSGCPCAWFQFSTERSKNQFTPAPRRGVGSTKGARRLLPWNVSAMALHSAAMADMIVVWVGS